MVCDMCFTIIIIIPVRAIPGQYYTAGTATVTVVQYYTGTELTCGRSTV